MEGGSQSSLEREISEKIAEAFGKPDVWRESLTAEEGTEEGLELDDFEQGVVNAIKALTESVIGLAIAVDRINQRLSRPA